MASFDLSAILGALQAYQRREVRQPNNRAVKQYLLNKGISERIAWSNSFNELCYWTEEELDDVFHDLQQLPKNVPLDKLISFVPRPQGCADPAPVFIKPSLEDIQQSASQLGALCVNRQGDFSINPKEGFAALSHVWSQGLGADDDNRGLDASLLHQVFDKVGPLGVQWIWTDSLAIPGGKRALNLVEEELKGKLINAMADIYRQAKFVVVLDALCLRLNSTDPVKVAAVISLGVWMTRMWTYQEIKLANNAIVATGCGFVTFANITDSLKGLALEETGENYDSTAQGKYPYLYRTFRRLQRDDRLGVSLPDVAFGCGYRHAWDKLDYARALFPTLGIEWKTKYTLSEAMHIIYRNRRRDATRLALYHGPARASLPGWAPATFNGLVDGKIIEAGAWEARGMRRSWMATKVKSIVPSKPGALILALESDFVEQALTVGFISEQTQKESPRSIEMFTKAVSDGNAYLLADEPLVPKQAMSRVGLLVERFTKVQDRQAWVLFTLAVGETEDTYKAEKEDWLLLHENPTSEEMFSGRGFTELSVDITNSTKPTTGVDLEGYALHEAVREGNAEQLRMLLQIIDVNTVDNRGWTPLHVAGATGQHELISTLIQHGAKLECFDNDDNSPLILAIDNQHLEAVLALCDAGADINASRSTSGLGLSPLSSAVLKGGVEMVNLVLALGANPSKVDAGNWYALHFALQKTATNGVILDALLEAGADVNTPSQKLLYPIDVAARQGDVLSIRKLLASGALPDPPAEGADSPLYHAIELGSSECIIALLDAGAKIDVTFRDGLTPIMLAAKQGDHEIGKLLASKGAAVTGTSPEGLTALHIAAMNGNRVFYKWLIVAGVDEQARDAQGRTAKSMIQGF